ncbi:putative mitochondrial protein [Trifolium repens]|jgi:hypothetical protein|nr:putative mitochondrial protein [Trifolium repens]
MLFTHHDHILPYIPSTNQFTWHYHTFCDPDPVHDTSIPIPDPSIDSTPLIPVHTVPNESTDTGTTLFEPLEHENSNEPSVPDTSLSTSDSINISSDNSSQSSSVPTHRPTRDKHAPSYLSDYVCNLSNTLTAPASTGNLYPISAYHSLKNLSSIHHAFTVSLTHNTEPKSYLEACKLERWQRAMDDELGALPKTGTWEIVDLPPHIKPIGSKWVYKVKYKADGTVERYKARLVDFFRHFLSSCEVNYCETITCYCIH